MLLQDCCFLWLFLCFVPFEYFFADILSEGGLQANAHLFLHVSFNLAVYN